MDYRTTILSQELIVDDPLLEDIDGLYFGFINEDRAVFDYTRYINENKLEPIDYKVFMRANKHFIEVIAADRGLRTSEIFFQNTNDHILIASELVFVCLAFIDNNLLRYFNALLTDITADGLAFSNTFILKTTTERVPSEVLKSIIRQREIDQRNEQ